jgi:[acyl-carrier-protein] S-malonyltransferase
VDRFSEQFMPKAIFLDPDRPLVSNVDGNLLLTKEEVKNEIVGQYTKSVQWYRCLQRLWDSGVRRLVVLGPGNFITKSLQFTDIPFEVETYLTAQEINNKLTNVIKKEV